MPGPDNLVIAWRLICPRGAHVWTIDARTDRDHLLTPSLRLLTGRCSPLFPTSKSRSAFFILRDMCSILS